MVSGSAPLQDAPDGMMLHLKGGRWTVFTIGFSAAVATLGVGCGVLVLFWHEPVWRLSVALGSVGDYLSPLYLALILAAVGFVFAYWIFSAQQAVAHWAANRAIARFEREFRALEQAHGTEAANELIKAKFDELALQSPAPFGLFDQRPILDAMRKIE